MLPEDLLKFGLIPEFVGRLPVLGVVENLDRDTLVKILAEPKNALVKQYEKIFELEDVELEFTEDALEAIADQALARGTGARGLRAILEEVLLGVMYELPSRDDVAQGRDRRRCGSREGVPDARAPLGQDAQQSAAPRRQLIADGGPRRGHRLAGQPSGPRERKLGGIAAGDVDGLSLEPMRELMDVLGDPQDAMPIIHVTGTNGKGSTVAHARSAAGGERAVGRHLHQPACGRHQRAHRPRRRADLR